MIKVILIYCIFLSALNKPSCQQVLRNKPQPTPYHDWDYLIFSQRWPLTICSKWMEEKNGNTCNLPKDKLWTIHGVWPTKTGHEGPLFCPSAIHFNPEELQPMLDDLTDHWTNIEANKKPNSFWAHEWNKHGTCASILPQFDSVTNYFRMGLRFNQQYELSSILSKGGIVPSNNDYDLTLIYNVVKNSLNKEPSIQCIVDQKTKESFISEIRICFNKTLDLIDCNPSNPMHRIRFGLSTNCNQKKKVKYISALSTSMLNDDFDDVDLEIEEFYEKQAYYTWLYNFLRTLLWLTL